MSQPQESAGYCMIVCTGQLQHSIHRTKAHPHHGVLHSRPTSTGAQATGRPKAAGQHSFHAELAPQHGTPTPARLQTPTTLQSPGEDRGNNIWQTATPGTQQTATQGKRTPDTSCRHTSFCWQALPFTGWPAGESRKTIAPAPATPEDAGTGRSQGILTGPHARSSKTTEMPWSPVMSVSDT